jgi:hypothetical protein
MKKLLSLLAISSAFMMCAFAQEEDTYRRTWDFTKGWSAETVDNLTTDNATWEVQGTGFQNKVNITNNAEVTVTVNGEKVVIPELAGMTISGNLYKAKHIQVVTTYSGVKDTPCFWLNGKGDAVTVKVPAGENVRFGYTTHKGGEARGFKCSSGFADANGQTQFTTSDNQEIQEVELINSNEGESNLTLTTTNGSHIYYIIIGKGDNKQEIEEDPNVVYIYGGDIDEDAFRQYAGLDDYSTVTDINISQLLDGTVTPDSLMTFDVAILAKSAYAVEGAAEMLKEGINYVPMLNLWPAEGLGYIPANNATAVLTVGEDYLDADLFKDVELGGDNGDELVMFNGESGVLGWTVPETSDFAGDEVYAKAGDANAIHLHYKRNTYMLLPIDPEQILADGDLNITDAGIALISNAVKYLRTTKVNVVDAVKPTATLKYEDGKTTVTLSSSLAGAKIYYTTDGTNPSVEKSAVYTEPLVFTEAATLKAKVKAPSYNSSAVLEVEVAVKTQLAAPAVSLNYGDGSTTITLSTSGDDAAIYYSFNGQTSADRATLYAEPVVITEPGTITAFTYGDNYLASEAVSSYVAVGGIPAVKDTLAHFNAGTTDWFDNAILHDHEGNVLETPTANWAAKAAYYFGKSPWEYYSTEVDHTEVAKDEEGNTIKSAVPGQEDQDSIVTYYKADPTAFRSITSATDTKWMITTQGQQLTGETNIAQLGYVKGEGAAAARYHDEAIDLIGGPATSGCLTMGGKNSGNPYTATVRTTEKYAAPFDVVVYANQSNGDGATVNVEVQISADGETWTKLGDVKLAYTMRHIKKTRLHYGEGEQVYVRVAHTGGSTKAQICDIYVISTDGTSGIRAIENTPAVVSNDVFYNVLGQQVDQDYKGLVIRGGKKMILR